MMVVPSRIRLTAGSAGDVAAPHRARLELAAVAPGCLNVEVLRRRERRDE